MSSAKNPKIATRRRKCVAITDGSFHDEKIPKQSELIPPNVKNKGLEMMLKMGYEGKGLGARAQGITEPVTANAQQSKRGLGLTAESVRPEVPKTEWTPNLDEASANGDIVLSIDGNRGFLDVSDLTTGMVVGKRLKSIEGQDSYCDPELLSEMLKNKTMLDNIGNLLDGRSRSNPYERIGAGIFLNRAAMKMANMDSVTGGLFTNTLNGETLYFADICAGPGGFTEYMLYRRPMQSCGFGFTLKEMNDFKLNDIICGPVECFHPSYGATDTGDIFIEANLRKFQQEVKSGTANLGVHTVLADGGFSVEGQENIQEILSKQLYLCQFLCAINILRFGGNFLCKLFDTFTTFSVNLIELVSCLFKTVSIIKPITSRPANSERYILFQNFLDDHHQLECIRDYLYLVNKTINDMKESEEDVLSIVAQSNLKMDGEFIKFMKKSNNRILEQQIVALAKLIGFVNDRNLVDERQLDIRDEALRLWLIPDVARDQFKADKLACPIGEYVRVHRGTMGALLAPGIKSIGVWEEEEFVKDKFVVRNYVAGFVSVSVQELENRTSYVLVKDKRVVKWYPKMSDQEPSRLTAVHKKWLMALPAHTLLLVHFSVEYGGDKGNLKVNSVTVLDGVSIYGEVIAHLPYQDRMKRISNLCRLTDPKAKGHIKPLDFFPLVSLETHVRDRMSLRTAKGGAQQQMISSANHQRFFPPWKLVLVNVVNNPWMIAASRSTNALYYYNVLTRQSFVDKPTDIDASYSESRLLEVDWSTNSQLFLDLFRKKAR